MLRALPPSIQPCVVVFRRGAFESRLRSLGFEVIVHEVARAFERASRYAPDPFSAVPAGPEVLRMAALLRRIKPAIVHTNTVKANAIGIPAARICRIPSVMHLRDFLDGGSRAILSGIGRYGASRVVAISQKVAEWYSVPRTRVVYNPFDLDPDSGLPERADARSRLGIRSDGPCFGIIGPIHPNKGHERFLRVMAALTARTDAVGVVVGDARFAAGPRDLPLLVQRARELGLGERVRFVPWLDDVRAAYAAIDVLCSCSFREPFGRTIVEAAARSIPSVIFDDCGASELLIDGVSALIAPAGDETAYAARLIALASEPNSRAIIGEGARRAVAGLTAERHAAEIERLYLEIRGGRAVQEKKVPAPG